jgi:hypothetical protein
MKKRAVLASTLIMFSVAVLPSSAQAVEYNAYGAACVVGSAGSSTFTATKRGFYVWVWRTGSTVNGSGVQYLSAGQTKVLATPSATTTSTRFGVLTGSATFAYVTCT